MLISMLRRARIVVQSRKETTFPIILRTSEMKLLSYSSSNTKKNISFRR